MFRLFAKIIGAVLHLEIEPQDGFLYSSYDLDKGFSLSRDQDLLTTEFLQEHFIESLGKFEIDFLANSMYLFSLTDTDEVPKEYHPINFNAVFENADAMLNVWLLALWMVKDNSVNIRKLYLYLVELDKSSVNMRFHYQAYSNASGKMGVTTFTIEELRESLDWLDVLGNYLRGKNRENYEVKTGFEKDDTELIYEVENRFLRALRFIIEGRGESFLPAKITSYITALESMLSTSTAELRFQVSERAAKIIGGSSDEKIANFDIVKDAYDARSAYVHGSLMSRKFRNQSSLEELSEK